MSVVGPIEEIGGSENRPALEARLKAGLARLPDLESQWVGNQVALEHSEREVELSRIDQPRTIGWGQPDRGHIHLEIGLVLLVEQGDLAGDPVVELCADSELGGSQHDITGRITTIGTLVPGLDLYQTADLDLFKPPSGLTFPTRLSALALCLLGKPCFHLADHLVLTPNPLFEVPDMRLHSLQALFDARFRERDANQPSATGAVSAMIFRFITVPPKTACRTRTAAVDWSWLASGWLARLEKFALGACPTYPPGIGVPGTIGADS